MGETSQGSGLGSAWLNRVHMPSARLALGSISCRRTAPAPTLHLSAARVDGVLCSLAPGSQTKQSRDMLQLKENVLLLPGPWPSASTSSLAVSLLSWLWTTNH